MEKEKLIKAITKHNKELTYDFSNFYFETKIWKKEYLANYGELPKNVPLDARKVPVFHNIGYLPLASLSASRHP